MAALQIFIQVREAITIEIAGAVPAQRGHVFHFPGIGHEVPVRVRELIRADIHNPCAVGDCRYVKTGFAVDVAQRRGCHPGVDARRVCHQPAGRRQLRIRAAVPQIAAWRDLAADDTAFDDAVPRKDKPQSCERGGAVAPDDRVDHHGAAVGIRVIKRRASGQRDIPGEGAVPEERGGVIVVNAAACQGAVADKDAVLEGRVRREVVDRAAGLAGLAVRLEPAGLYERGG